MGSRWTPLALVVVIFTLWEVVMAGKFDFDDLTEEPDRGAKITCVYGEAKKGKTTLICDIPRLFMACPEKGLANIARPPPHFKRVPKNLNELYEAMSTFRDRNRGDERRFDHFAIDSLSWVQAMVHADGRAEARTRNLGEDFQRGWGQVATIWEEFFAKLDRFRTETGCHVWLVAHAERRPEVHPDGSTSPKWDLELERKAAAYVRKSVDHCLFLATSSRTSKASKQHRTIGQYTGLRVYFRDCPDHFAGSRSSAPEMCPATARHVLTALASEAPADGEKIRAELALILPGLPEEERVSLEQEIAAARGPRDLARILWVAQSIASQHQIEDDEEEPAAAPAAPAGIRATKPAPLPVTVAAPPVAVPVVVLGDDEEGFFEPAVPLAAAPPLVPPTAVLAAPTASSSAAPLPVAPASAERPAYVVEVPKAPVPAPPAEEDDESKARRLIRDANDAAAIGKAFVAMSKLRLPTELRTQFAEELRAKKASLASSVNA